MAVTKVSDYANFQDGQVSLSNDDDIDALITQTLPSEAVKSNGVTCVVTWQARKTGPGESITYQINFNDKELRKTSVSSDQWTARQEVFSSLDLKPGVSNSIEIRLPERDEAGTAVFSDFVVHFKKEVKI